MVERTEAPRPWEPGGSVDGYTVPRLLRDRAVADPDVIGLRRRRGPSDYEGFTWGALWDDSRRIAIGLRAAGLVPGDRVAIMGVASIDLVVAELAVWTAGGVSVGIYPTSSASEVRFMLEDSGAKFFIAETSEHLARVPAATAAELAALERRVIIADPKTGDRDADLTTLDELREAGRTADAELGAELDRAVEEQRDDAPCCITYTSGTTGQPKGVLHTHATLLSGAITKPFLVPDLKQAPHRSVVHLPVAHVSPKAGAILVPLLSRLVPHFAGPAVDHATAAREVRPTYIVHPPRFYEKLASELLVSIERRPATFRRLYAVAAAIGRRVVRLRWNDRTPSPPLRALHALARRLVFERLLAEVGYDQIEHAYVGSAPASPEMIAVWHTWGLDLRESYGLTEASGSVIAQQRPFPRPGTIGSPTPIPGWTVRLADDGEILIRTPCNFVGYWNRPEETAAAVVDGWFHSGDIATMDDRGELTLVDRKKELITTSGGKTLSPQQIEQELKASRYISEAVAVGHGRKFVTALIEIDAGAVREALADRGLDDVTYRGLVEHPDVTRLVAEEVERANEQLSRVEQVKRFRLLPVELASSPEMLTPTRKVKRRVVTDRFADLIASMYEDATDAETLRGHAGSLLLPDAASHP